MNLLKEDEELKRVVARKEREKARREHLISTGVGMVERCFMKLKQLDPEVKDDHPFIMHYHVEMNHWGEMAEKWMNHVDHKR